MTWLWVNYEYKLHTLDNQLNDEHRQQHDYDPLETKRPNSMISVILCSITAFLNDDVINRFINRNNWKACGETEIIWIWIDCSKTHSILSPFFIIILWAGDKPTHSPPRYRLLCPRLNRTTIGMNKTSSNALSLNKPTADLHNDHTTEHRCAALYTATPTPVAHWLSKVVA